MLTDLKLKINKFNKGYSLIEILVVLSVFAVLGILVTQTIALSIRGSKKSEASSKVRSSLNEASLIVERRLRNADSIERLEPPGVNEDNKITYINEDKNLAYFACNSGKNLVYKLDGNDEENLINMDVVTLDVCTITYIPGDLDKGVPESVELNLSGYDKNVSGAESSRIDIQTKILLRNY